MRLRVAKIYEVNNRGSYTIKNIDYPNPISLIGNFSFLIILISSDIYVARYILLGTLCSISYILFYIDISYQLVTIFFFYLLFIYFLR